MNANDIDPIYLDFAERILEEEFSLRGDMMRVRRRELAATLERATRSEIADLRAAEARRMIALANEAAE